MKRIDIEGDKFAVTIGYDPDAVALLRRIPGRKWDRKRKWNLIPITAISAPMVLNLRKHGFQMTPEVVAVAKEAARQGERIKGASFVAFAKPIKWLDQRFGLQLFPSQWADIRWGLEGIEPGKGLLLGNQTGIGKTISSAGLIEAMGAYPCLILCPNNVKPKWVRDLKRLLPERSVGMLGRGGDGNLKADLVVLNFQALRNYMPRLKDRIAKRKERQNRPEAEVQQYGDLTKRKWQGMIVDECQAIKNRPSQRSRFTRILLKRNPYSVLTSGTPVVNKPEDFIVPMEAINRLAEIGGYEEFMRNYVRTDDPRRLLHLNIIIRKTFYRRMERFDQVLADGTVIPGVQPELPKVLLSPTPMLEPLTNQKDYDEADADLIAWLSKIDVMRARAAEKAEAINRINVLRQLVALGKLKGVFEWTDEFMEGDDKLIVFANHRAIQKALTARYPDAARLLGGQGLWERELQVQRFQTEAECRMVICSIGSVKEGIDLTAGSNVLIVELPWTWMEIEQMIGRCYGRYNDAHGATAHFPHVPNTIEDFMATLLDKKRVITTAAQSGYEVEREQLLMELLANYGSRAA